LAIFLIFPLLSGIKHDTVSATCESSPVSSRKLQTGTSLGEEGSARDTRLCFTEELVEVEDGDEAGNGALNENVEVDGSWSLDVGDGIDPRTADVDMLVVWQMKTAKIRDIQGKIMKRNQEIGYEVQEEEADKKFFKVRRRRY
jgi:hypothetical protein